MKEYQEEMKSEGILGTNICHYLTYWKKIVLLTQRTDRLLESCPWTKSKA